MVPPYKKQFVKNALFISHTSLADFIRCPRAYYLRNLYREPEFGFKLQIASPYLTLGVVVHNTIKWYLQSPLKPSREETMAVFRNTWKKYRLEKGGFTDSQDEAVFGKRGVKMMENFLDHARVLEPAAPFLEFPKFELSEGVILHGNFDFVGEGEDGGLHIVDFKTGIKEEEDPLQLYIYAILAEANFQKPVTSISFWYLDKDDGPKDVVLDALQPRLEWLVKKSREIQEAIKKNKWVCIKDPGLCRDCRDYQLLIDGKGKYLYTDSEFKKMIYFLNRTTAADDETTKPPF